MTIAELIKELQKLDPDYEVGIFTAHARARPIEILRVNPLAGYNNLNKFGCGFHDVTRAYLLRPAQEII